MGSEVPRRVDELVAGSVQKRSGADMTDLFRLTFDHTASFVAVLSADGTLLEANRSALSFTGLTRDSVVGLPLWETPWLRPQARRLVRTGVTRAARGIPLRHAFEVVRRDGQLHPLDVSLRLVRTTSASRAYILVEGQVACEKVGAGALGGPTYQSLVDALGAGVLWHDHHGLVLSCNGAAERILGRSRVQLLGSCLTGQGWRSVREDGAPYPETDHPALVALRTGVAQRGTVMGVPKPGGAVAWVLVSAQPLFRNGDPAPYAAVTSVVDITTFKEVEQALRHAALHDALTGLGTRSLLYDRLEHAVAHLKCDPDAHFALLFVDLDGFKAVNDALGHAAGDALLVAAAQRLKGCVRAHDTVARLGGDEFAVLLEGSGLEAAEGFAARVVRNLGDLVSATDHRTLVSASVGVAVAQPGLGSSELMQRADAAMYRAKMAGRARYCVAPPTLAPTGLQSEYSC